MWHFRVYGLNKREREREGERERGGGIRTHLSFFPGTNSFFLFLQVLFVVNMFTLAKVL